jgi:tetratricopeptide (TPR) repeat protein
MRIKARVLFIMWFAVVGAACSSSKVNEASVLFHEGVDLYNRGDCDNAQSKFVNAVQSDPKIREAYFYMADCALKKGDYDESLSFAKKALSLIANKKDKERFEKFFLIAGQNALKNEDSDNAILFFDECVSISHNDSDCHLWLGNSLLERAKDGDMKRAISEFKAAFEKSEYTDKTTFQIREFLFEKAKEYSLKGDTYSESRCYLAYTENFKPDIDAYVALGRIFLSMGNPVGSLYYAKKAYALEPKNKAVMELMDDLSTPFH